MEESAVEPRAAAAAPKARDAAAVGTGGLIALSCAHFAVDCCTGIFPVFKALAGLDLALAGAVATAAGVLANGMQIFFGIMADRGWRRVLLTGGVLLAGSAVFLPYAHGYFPLFLVVLATSLGSAAFHPTGAGTAGGASQGATGVRVAIFMTGGYAGYGMSQIIFARAWHASQGRTAGLYILSLAGVLGLLLAAVAPAAANRLRGGQVDWRATASSLAPLFVVQMVMAALSSAFVFLLPELLQTRGAPRWVSEGAAHLAYVLGSAVALLPAGHLSDRYGARRVLLAANVASFSVLLPLLLLSPGAYGSLALCAAFGAFHGANNVVIVAEGNRVMPGRSGTASALLMGLPWCLAAFAPLGAGALANPLGGGTPERALLWLSLCIPAALATLLFWLPAQRNIALPLHSPP